MIAYLLGRAALIVLFVAAFLAVIAWLLPRPPK